MGKGKAGLKQLTNSKIIISLHRFYSTLLDSPLKSLQMVLFFPFFLSYNKPSITILSEERETVIVPKLE